ncbi:MAG: pyridoxamine 5'-phosphate oxidase family protein [bacterium]|jgi:hypothetical protein
MDLKQYFSDTNGTGVIATADSDGKVDAAIYAKPYVLDEKTVVFIAADRLTRKNLKSNPRAAFLFMEAGEGFSGKRLFLTMTRESSGEGESEAGLVEWYEKSKEAYPKETLYLAYFRVDEVLPLVSEL